MSATNGNSPHHQISGAPSDVDSDPARVVDPLKDRGPDVLLRLARIATLQRAITAGTYDVPAQAVAEKMVERLLHTPTETAPPNLRPGQE